MDGIINILKPPGMTSHDVVQFVRRTFKIKKVGHTGTLDPGVPGVLPICLGKATRVAEYLTGESKSYRGILKLGSITDTQDAFGEVISEQDASHITESDIEGCFEHFLGPIEQIPPMVSAVKVKGKKLYELARKGIEIERKPRKIIIKSLEVIKYNGIGKSHPEVMFDVTCSKGTYIRTLCHDIGERLGCGGFMEYLVRTSSGLFKLDSTYTLEELKELADHDGIEEALLPIDTVLYSLPEVVLKDSALRSVGNGNKIYPQGVEEINDEIKQDQEVRLKDMNGNLLAIAKTIEDTEREKRWVFQPIKVFC